MKIRYVFVSNSSSSSFVLQKDKLSAGQIDAIKRYDVYAAILDKHYNNIAKDLEDAGFDVIDIDYRLRQRDLSEKESYFGYTDKWSVKETETEIIIGCLVDNFDMGKFLSVIDVPSRYIRHEPDVDLTYEYTEYP